MSGAPQEQGNPVNTPFRVLVFIFGAVGLVGAMMTDAIAVVGRQIRMPFLGSVEVAQVCVVLIAGASLVAATLLNEHASVRVFTERMSGGMRARFGAFAHVMNAIYFALLSVGSGWIAWELLDGAERTEMLGFPVGWLRACWLVCASVCVVMLLRNAFKKGKTP